MKNLTPFIDESANMSIHAREGGYAEFEFQLDDGTPRDMSGAAIFFEVEGFRKQLVPHPTDLSIQILTLDRGDLNSFISRLTTYVILDETEEIPKVVVQGNVRVYGWA